MISDFALDGAWAPAFAGVTIRLTLPRIIKFSITFIPREFSAGYFLEGSENHDQVAF
jgi:hypothetical protein